MRSKYLWLGPVMALALGLTACGDDDGDAAPDASGEDASATPEDGIGAEACDAVLGVGEALTSGPDGPPTPEYIEGELQPAVDAVADAGVEELVGPAEDLSAAAQEALDGDQSAEERAFAAYGEMAEVAHTGCGFQTAEVTAVDYGFEGIPASLPAGMTSFALTNEGEEEHELVLLRRNEGETRSVEELLDLPEEEAMAAVTFSGVTFVSPGGTGYLPTELEPGSHIAICFIPVGGGEEGPPHFTEGMVTEFEVS